MTAIVPELPSHQRAAGAGIIGFTSAASLYAGSMLGLLVGSGTVSHDVAFLFMLIINVINIPIGCLGEYSNGLARPPRHGHGHGSLPPAGCRLTRTSAAVSHGRPPRLLFRRAPRPAAPAGGRGEGLRSADLRSCGLAP